MQIDKHMHGLLQKNRGIRNQSWTKNIMDEK